MGKNSCEKHNELLAEADAILAKLHALTAHQRTIVGADGVSKRFLQLDQELELMMGEKERAIGALREHDEEHGCQISKD